MDKKAQINRKIDIENNKQSIEYYEYLRCITQNKESAYWIGNPSVEIISGKLILEPLVPVKAKNEPQNFELYLEQIRQVNIVSNNSNDSNKQFKKPSQQNNNRSPKKQEDNKNNFFRNINVDSSPEKVSSISTSTPITSKRSRCLLLCGIPNSKSPIEILQTNQIGSLSRLIIQIRVIKTIHIKYYGMLLLMESQNAAQRFFNELFAERFNYLQMQRIVLRKITQISLSFTELNTKGNNEMMLLRQLKKDDGFVKPQSIFMTYHHKKLKQKIMSQSDKETISELVCAICFEQCSQETISILCGHYFDFSCLQRWSENICPLCRYHQQPPIIKFCERCNQCEGLWVCLICGERLCCGVQNDILSQDSHIYDHFKVSGHSLSMQLETKFLFDAKIPAFLHQKFYKDLLISEQEGAKQITKGQFKEASDCKNNKKAKITQQIYKYENQVAQQMKKQRRFFQKQIDQNSSKHQQILNKKRALVQHLKDENKRLSDQAANITEESLALEGVYQKKQKQLEVLQNIIKMKIPKVEEKKKSFSNIKKIKQQRLSQIEQQIKERKQELYNYRKNIKLKQQFQEKLKNQQIQGDAILQTKNNFQKNKKKSKNTKGK